MAEYKGRRVRRRASGGKVDGGGPKPPHGHMLIVIGLGKPKGKPKKAGGKVQGEAARHHMGKRARGSKPKRADGGGTDDWSDTGAIQSRQPTAGRVSPNGWGGTNFGIVSNEPVGAKFSRAMSDDSGPKVMGGPENRSVTRSNLPPAYPGSNPQAAGRSGPPLGPDMSQAASRQSAPFRSAQKSAPPVRRAAPPVKSGPSADDLMDYWNGPADNGSGMSRWEAKKAADGLARGGRALDARTDANDPDEDGRDKVSQRGGTQERAVEMGDARLEGGAVPYARGGFDTRKSGGATNKWIQGARERMDKKGTKGALHRELGVKEGEKIPRSKMEHAKAKAEREGDTKTIRRITFAENVRR